MEQRKESGAQEGGSQSRKPGLYGCKSHLSLCKHTLRHTRAHTQTRACALRAQFTRRFTYMPRRAQRHKGTPMQSYTHTHKYKGTLRHVNARCPHKHAQVPVRSHEPLRFCFLPCSKRWNTASGWIAEAGRNSPATKPAGPCLTLPSAPLGQSWASVCLPRHPGQALEGRGWWWVAGWGPAPSSLICDPA